MLITERRCEACGHRPTKGFAQRLGETMLTCGILGTIVIFLFLLARSGAGS